MSTFSSKNDQGPSSQHQTLTTKVKSARWTLLSTLVLIVIILVLKPELSWLGLGGFALIVLVTTLTPYHIHQAPLRKKIQIGRQTIFSQIRIIHFANALEYPVYIYDHTGILHHSNPGADDMFGTAHCGHPLSFKFRAPEINHLVNKTIETNSRQSTKYHELVPSERWFEVSATPIKMEEQEGYGKKTHIFILSFIDQTKTKKIEQMRSDFIANASHELRTPLTSVMGFIDTLQGSARDDQKNSERFLTIMAEQAERMSRLIDALLSLSQIELKSNLQPTEIVDLDEIINHVLDAMYPLSDKLGVDIEKRIDEGDWRVHGDRDELIQLFENLIDNGCKYGQQGGKLLVELARNKNTDQSGCAIIASVTDFGPGILPEHIHRLTERFYRVGVDENGLKKGMGLGLAIAKHIVNHHKAKLSIHSQLGEGATFTIGFPNIDISK